MYGYYEHTNITPEQLLQKVDQAKVFEWILGRPVIFGEYYKSPFRENPRARCYFLEREDGTILFIDFGDARATHRSCLRMVMDSQTPPLNLSQAIEAICVQFGLSKNSADYKPMKQFVVEENVKSKTTIKYLSKPFDKRDIKYWNQFLITTENLIEDNVFSVRKYTKLNKKGVYTKYVNGLCYSIDFLVHVKLYMPYDKMRFITNCDEDDVGNIDNLSHWGEKLIVSKSYKDHRVIRNVLDFHDVIWLMNEGCSPNDYILKNLLSRFENIIIFFDNDIPGLRAGYKLRNKLLSLSPSHKIYIRYIPIQLPYKDAGELVSKEGRADTHKLLTKILKI